MTNYVPALSVRIEVAGGALTNPGQLSELRIQQRLGFPTQCEVSFSSLAGSPGSIAIGQKLEIAIQNLDEALFSGEITAVEYVYPSASAPALRVRGYDFLHRLRKRQQVRAFPEQSLRHLLGALTENKAVLVGEDLSWPLLIQHQQTDLEFACELASMAGCYPIAREGTAYFIPLTGLPRQAEIPLVYGHNLYEARIEANAEESCNAVTAQGWETNVSGALNGRAGKSKAEGGLFVDVTTVGGQPDRTLINQSLNDDAQARALARAEIERRQASEVVLWGRAEGNPALQPGVPVRVSNVAPVVENRFVLTTVTHSFDYTSGYTVELSSEPPPAPLRSRCDVATLGQVTDVRDPQNLGRVRARLPSYSSVETSWMPVVCPGAGRGKGFLTPPEVGDRVLVLLSREDPARGIVLGGLYAPDNSIDEPLKAGETNRYIWQTSDGQRVSLDPNANLVLIENGKGAEIEMRGNEIVFHAGRIDFRRS